MMQSSDITALIANSGVAFAQWPHEVLPARVADVLQARFRSCGIAAVVPTAWGYLVAIELQGGRKQIALMAHCDADPLWPGTPSCYLDDVIEVTALSYPTVSACSGEGACLALLESDCDTELTDCLLQLFEYGLLERTIALSCYSRPSTSTLACPA
ncbi:hypothetical protein [Noviherbaspirillum pedocola]|uniref:Uncharacterized protein n=1 Tax=Noviherbaspirillum pedocola TaxID=2801341 RepID=A0A934SVC2_9BURK|nr:hypothetical protein [Noviherbaspirillum pedocola]MBK4736100.1 hypothetical protein [Noviherbaspirillum pedocola]